MLKKTNPTDFVENKSKIRSQLRKAKVKWNYVDKYFYVVIHDGNKFNITDESLDKFSTAKLIYSLPANDRYPAWTIKKNKIQHKEITQSIKESWSVLSDNLIVYGEIVNDLFNIIKL